MNDKRAVASFPEAPCTYSACLRVSPLHCCLNHSLQCAILEGPFLAQSGGGGCIQKTQGPTTNSNDITGCVTRPFSPHISSPQNISLISGPVS